MEKSGSKHERVFQPSYWPDSRSGNLPEIFASDSVELVAVKSERKQGCVLPPIVEPSQPTVENTNSAIGRSGSFNFAQNDRCENLNDYKSGRFLNNRTNATVIDGKVPNRKEPMVEGLVRIDAAFVSTGQRAAVTELHPRAGLDTKKSRDEKTVFQRRNGSSACPTSQNVIIEEIYLLSVNKRAIPMEQKSRRQGICDHPSLRETRSDETNGVRGIRRCGEMLSRRVYYGGAVTDLSSLEELGTGVGKATRSRKPSGIRGHRSLRKTRSDESNGFREIRPCGKNWSHGLVTTSNASLHVKEGIDEVVHISDKAGAESEERKGQRMSRERASEDNSEAASAAESEQEKEQWRQLQGVSDAAEETKGTEEENMACVVTAESVKRQKQRRRRQRVSEANIETKESKEENLPCGVKAGVTAKSAKKQEQRSRRVGICENVDKTAAYRRRAKVLRKKLFGEDLPTDYELMIEQTTRRALNKKL